MDGLQGGESRKAGRFGAQDPRAQTQATEVRLIEDIQILLRKTTLRADDEDGRCEGRQCAR